MNVHAVFNGSLWKTIAGCRNCRLGLLLVKPEELQKLMAGAKMTKESTIESVESTAGTTAGFFSILKCLWVVPLLVL